MLKKIICILLGHNSRVENMDFEGFKVDAWSFCPVHDFVSIEHCERCKTIINVKIVRDNEIVKIIKG